MSLMLLPGLGQTTQHLRHTGARNARNPLSARAVPWVRQASPSTRVQLAGVTGRPSWEERHAGDKVLGETSSRGPTALRWTSGQAL